MKSSKTKSIYFSFGVLYNFTSRAERALKTVCIHTDVTRIKLYVYLKASRTVTKKHQTCEPSCTPILEKVHKSLWNSEFK